jgi:prevent-host-death family protein
LFSQLSPIAEKEDPLRPPIHPRGRNACTCRFHLPIGRRTTTFATSLLVSRVTSERFDVSRVDVQDDPVEISAGKFKAACLKLMDRVVATGETIIITKRGKPLAKLVPAGARSSPRKTGFGSGKGTILFMAPDDELLAPFPATWNVFG